MREKWARYEHSPNLKHGRAIAVGLCIAVSFAWFVAGELHILNPSMLPSMQDVGIAFWRLFRPTDDETLFSTAQIFKYSSFAENVGVTAFRVAAACAIGIPIGVLLGTVAAISTRIRPTLYVIAYFFYATPLLLLLVPAALLGFTGSHAAIAVGTMVVTGSTFVMVCGTLSDPALQGVIDAGRALGLGIWKMLFLIVLPNPTVTIAIASTLVIAVKTASGGVAVAELFSTSNGLGALFKVAFTNDRLPESIAIGMCVLALVGVGPLMRVVYLRISMRMWKLLFFIAVRMLRGAEK